MADSTMRAYQVREDQEPPEPRDGETWISPVTGQRHRWNGAIERWEGTGQYPYGVNPLDF